MIQRVMYYNESLGKRKILFKKILMFDNKFKLILHNEIHDLDKY